MLYKFCVFLLRIWTSLAYRVEYIGNMNIKDDEGILICSNHKHWFDPAFVALTTKRTIHFMGKKELFANKVIGYFLKKLNVISVDRAGNDLYAMKVALKTLRDRHVLGIFPEGTRNSDEEHLIELKGGVAIMAIKSKARIVPMYLHGKYKLFSKIKVVLGEAFDLSEYYDKKLNSEDYERIANEQIANKIYKLKELV